VSGVVEIVSVPGGGGTVAEVPVPLRVKLNVPTDVVTVPVAVRVPTATGAKVIVISQTTEIGKMDPQVSNSAKSPGLAPARVMLVIVALVASFCTNDMR